MRQISFLLVLLLIAFNVQGQDRITVYGSVSDEFGTSIPTPTIVNASTSQRISATLAGTFTATINRSDSLFVFYPGFKAEYLKFTDSIPQAEYIVYVRLRRPSVELQEAIIRADKPMFEIKRDISQLEKKNPNTYKKVSPMSPITLLWQKFSAKEKEKRAVAELEYQQEIKQIVADLLRQYVKNDIIEYLDDEQIRLVADDIHIPDYFLKKASEYDLAVYLKLQVKLILDK
jgi:hypothetical protein